MEDKGYKTAYLHLFNRISDLIESLEQGGYQSDVVAALKGVQQAAEQDFIDAAE